MLTGPPPKFHGTRDILQSLSAHFSPPKLSSFRAPPTPRDPRRLTGTYGYQRVHADLTMGMGITVCERTVWMLMSQAGVYGLPGPTRIKRLRGVVTADDDLLNRKLPAPSQRAVGHRHRAPRGAVEPSGGEGPARPRCRSSVVKLGAA